MVCFAYGWMNETHQGKPTTDNKNILLHLDLFFGNLLLHDRRNTSDESLCESQMKLPPIETSNNSDVTPAG